MAISFWDKFGQLIISDKIAGWCEKYIIGDSKWKAGKIF